VRLSAEAPEIDGSVYLPETEAVPGGIVEVVITDAREYGLMEGEKGKKEVVRCCFRPPFQGEGLFR
jgi:hypothetical protein